MTSTDRGPATVADAGRRPPWWQGLNLANLGWTLGLAVSAAAALNPIFMPPFPVLLGRTVFVALVLLLAFVVAGRWSRSWPPRWVVQVGAVALAAPLATGAIYLVNTGGDLQAILDHPGRLAGFLWISCSALALGVVLSFSALLRERESRARNLALQWRLDRERLERQALDARLALLTAQIEPHFLFNTLANVQALVETGSPRASEVLRSLIAYLRAALPRLHDDGGLPPLANEVTLVRAYLELMHLRMPDRLRFSVDVAPALQAERFPPMALLTLVENAVRHGIDPAEAGGEIQVGAERGVDGGLRLWVDDSGVGLDPRAVPGTGLANLRQRLQQLYGEGAQLQLSPRQAGGLRALLVLPAAAAPEAR